MRMGEIPQAGDYVGIDDKQTGQHGNFVYVAEVLGWNHQQTEWDILDEYSEERTVIRDESEDNELRRGWKDIHAQY